ncbi:hypothetical protein [Anaeromyxobacter sp. PSR-1]|nr:hypothetical protein [Anaeromyxobacter sp. PSR-1]GAO01924.1 hypothetical protein PSR1_00787 [Anaeromyxobacter sp. PSR-1]
MDDIYHQWEDTPPLNMLAAIYLGVKKEKPKRASKEGLRKLAQTFGGK